MIRVVEAVNPSHHRDLSEQDVLELIPRALALFAEAGTEEWLCRFCMRNGKNVTFPTNMGVKQDFKGAADTTSARRRKNPQRPQLWLTPRRKGTPGCSTHLLHPPRYTYPCTEAEMHGLQAPYQHGQEWHTCAPAAAKGARPPPYDYELQRKCKPSAPSSCITRLDQSSGWAQRPEFSRGHRRTLTAQEQRPLWHTRVAALRKVAALLLCFAPSRRSSPNRA